MAAAGIDVSGLTLPEATNKIAFLANTQMNSPLSSRVAGRRFLMRPKEVDFKFDAAKSARRAYNAGAAAAGAPVERAAVREVQGRQGPHVRRQGREGHRPRPA